MNATARGRRWKTLCAASSLLLLETAAFAQTGSATSAGATSAVETSAEQRALAPPSTMPAASRHRLLWVYPRFRWWEYAGAGVTTVGLVTLELVKRPEERWTKPILADAAVRRWLRAETPEGRHRARLVGDSLWYGSTAYVVLDSLVTPLATDHGNTDVALQLTLLNWQAIGSAGVVLRLAHATAGRARPSLQDCSNEPGAENHCEVRGPSFFAGHAMMTSVNAGLACAHHLALPLYGGGMGDAVVCPVMVTGALTVGVTRMMMDKHWFSDTLVGWVLGGGIGFGMPWLLHYRYVRAVASPLPNTAIVPWGDATSGGLQFIGEL